eukprot:2812315-Amphidinium_carterae.2
MPRFQAHFCIASTVQEQGWLIKGLEPPRIREDRAELQGAEILRVKVNSSQATQLYGPECVNEELPVDN